MAQPPCHVYDVSYVFCVFLFYFLYDGMFVYVYGYVCVL